MQGRGCGLPPEDPCMHPEAVTDLVLPRANPMSGMCAASSPFADSPCLSPAAAERLMLPPAAAALPAPRSIKSPGWLLLARCWPATAAGVPRSAWAASEPVPKLSTWGSHATRGCWQASQAVSGDWVLAGWVALKGVSQSALQGSTKPEHRCCWR